MDEKSAVRPARVCSAEGGCARKYYAKGYCEAHYHRLRIGPKCKVPGCGRTVRAQGWCKAHYTRWQTYGDAEAPLLKAPAGSGTIDDNGYRRVVVDGKIRREHRVVLEQVLHRELYPFENVHHKNGVRTDNAPENLELWVRPQPCGQRPEDLVAFVVQHYPDLVRKALG